MAIPAADPVGTIARGRGGFLRNAIDVPYITAPDGVLVKSGARKGEIARLAYGSPSSRGKLIEDTWALNKYGERRIVMGIGADLALIAECAAVAKLDPETAEYREAADRVVLRAKDAAKSALAAEQGSHTHALSEDYDEDRDWIARAKAGENMGLPADVQEALVQAWRTMLGREGLQILAVEAACVDDRWRLAGTLDRIARTTKPLRFAKVTGEIVEIPVGTVLVLDIKSGKKRTRNDGSIMFWAGYSVQIASYAQSLPYDVTAETRGEWPWAIDQQHALIAHLSVENALAGNPTCELIYVDLAAGREDGGDTVCRAKAWSDRRDVFSVQQIASADPKGVRDAVEEGSAPTAGHPPDSGTANPSSMTIDGTDPPPVPPEEGAAVAPAAAAPSLTAQQQLATLNNAPDEGAAADPEAVKALELRYNALDPAVNTWLRDVVLQAIHANVSFHLKGHPTTRRFELLRALISLSTPDDETVRCILATILGDVAHFPAATIGHLVGSLDATGAALFAERCDAFVHGVIKGHVAPDGTVTLDFAA